MAAEVLETVAADKDTAGAAQAPPDPVLELRSRRAERGRQYWQLVGRLAAGERVTAGALEKAADGRTPERVEADVALMRERVELRKVIAAAVRAEERARDLRQALHVANERFAQAQREHNESVRAIRSRLAACAAAIEQAAQARERLIATCPDESLRARLAEVVGERERLVRRLADVEPDARPALEAKAAELLADIEAVRAEMLAF